ncbi:MAG: methionine--tRNA ligase subunit beta [bacterium]|nr:methionine--tRNA ligase subunit beta [bacterium]
MSTISFKDFKKLDIRIGKIITAERIPNSDKLLRLVFDLGTEQRQVLAGIAEFVTDPAELVGKEMPVVVNLEPRVMRGLESQGMILAADDEGHPVLLRPEKEVPPGSVVK